MFEIKWVNWQFLHIECNNYGICYTIKVFFFRTMDPIHFNKTCFHEHFKWVRDSKELSENKIKIETKYQLECPNIFFLVIRCFKPKPPGGFT